MADQQKRTEGPLNAFYAALLSGKLSLGSLGSSFGGPTPRAAMKRKPEDKSSISEPSKKQRTQQQKVVHEPSKSAKPNQGCATSKLRERQQQKKQPASSEKGSASSGKKLVPAWQKVDSDDSGDEGIEKGEAKEQQRAIGNMPYLISRSQEGILAYLNSSRRRSVDSLSILELTFTR